MRPVTTVHGLDVLTIPQAKDLDMMITRMRLRLDEIRVGASESRRREAGEWVLRVAAEIYSWSR